MRTAYRLACRTLPEHSCKFSRHDFTLAQLFACLVMREFFGLSFRRTEALLVDAPDWLADIGLTQAPDHNTLWRASASLLASRRCNRMLDLLADLFAKARLLTPRTSRWRSTAPASSGIIARDITIGAAGTWRWRLPRSRINIRENGAKP